MEQVAIYGLQDPCNGMIRYIGKSGSPRKRRISHIAEARRTQGQGTKKDQWIRKLLTLGLRPELIILEWCDEEDWVERERHHIAIYDGLTNMNEGGHGRSSIHITAEDRRKISERLMGHKVSAETRRKISEAQKGKKHTLETRRKRSEAQKGKKHTAETKRKISESKKGKKRTAETRRKISVAKKGKKQTLEHRRAHSILTENEVRAIRELYTGQGGITQNELGRRFGVSRETIRNVVLRYVWDFIE